MTDQQQHQNLSQSRDGGYTIIESLVAMIVVSVLMIAIAPVMAFSVATRVQARRTELATQGGKAYIDALRTGAIRPTGSTAPGFPKFDANQNPAAPGSLAGLYCYNLDDTPACNGSKDFFIQGIRDVNNNPTDTGYSLIVRVYRADAVAPLLTDQQSVANGLGNSKAPLVVMKTEIPPTTNGGSSARQSLCSRLNPNGTINPSVCK
ncbi:prepilin-type N-terminal cleavage/methylation domain-containing protein [Microcoleus sp. T3_A4]|uniref:prepilin-type N-terminal cleavage/methylation domain-containing protein n=1 Tax=Microcoleus sp. T3_A4 TaxID=2818968 RepID=UPI002FD2BF8F